MIDNGLVEALNRSIDRLNAGGSLRDCLLAHPREAAELEPLLRLGLIVRQLSEQAGAPTDAAEAAAMERQRLRVEWAAARQFPARVRRRTSIVPGVAARWIASLALMVVLLAGGATLLAESSLPGDALYGLKLWTESVRLTLNPNDPALAASFAGRRIDEAEALIRLRRPAAVTLTGVVDAVLADAVRIEGLTVQVDTSGLRPGSRVEVEVQSTEQGALIARRLRLLDAPPDARPGADLAPAPTAASSPTAGRRATVPPPPATAPPRGSDGQGQQGGDPDPSRAGEGPAETTAPRSVEPAQPPGGQDGQPNATPVQRRGDEVGGASTPSRSS